MITIGTRIKYLRMKHGMTMKYLGQMIGFPAASADVRISQYENDSRTPKPELIRKLADVLEIAPAYLSIPVPSTPEEIKVIEFWQEELSSRD
ncbi:helix-turn-helix domain-containing protein [Faecalicatena contorta]|uniref:helix-turn-helix domain-containing protein n=1 Tax=Faecalicatena contorta TaxID=39482 RepID=UPI001F337EFF|nr:helix-turn-helix transcriptional regulator [Faecalicatena contorta]MCF2682465.1 helix-turn-helix transcriptional regulator [Faecalicatena contorta]